MLEGDKIQTIRSGVNVTGVVQVTIHPIKLSYLEGTFIIHTTARGRLPGNKGCFKYLQPTPSFSVAVSLEAIEVREKNRHIINIYTNRTNDLHTHRGTTGTQHDASTLLATRHFGDARN